MPSHCLNFRLKHLNIEYSQKCLLTQSSRFYCHIFRNMFETERIRKLLHFLDVCGPRITGVMRLERLKNVEDEVKTPQRPPSRSQGLEGRYTFFTSVFIKCK